MEGCSEHILLHILSLGGFIKNRDERRKGGEKKGSVGMADNFEGFQSSFSNLVVGGGKGSDEKNRDVWEKSGINVGLRLFLDDVPR